MVKAVLANMAAGSAHPDDDSLRIQHIAVVDSKGIPTSGGSHVYGYANGNLVSDTWSVGDVDYVKYFTYANGVLVGESDWVKK
ncbi:hypothetical protein FHW58_003411 [Duganella sp. 1224]|uniref:hypothetical protein n=1 Tax=Duganella sp. 1224 TaxID=2587052 RepID=UPI0015C75E11|nr:hypothetical protein [Duganella sp. 1224]NYE62196.1 hypothetical protein [Duganella sp. 1224]